MSEHFLKLLSVTTAKDGSTVQYVGTVRLNFC